MSKPTLLWQNNMFPDSEKLIAAKYFDVVSFDILNGKKVSELIEGDEPFSMRGSVAMATRLGMNLDMFDVRKFAPHLHQYMISKSFWWQVADNIEAEMMTDEICGIPSNIFIRPDSSKKLFPGQVYSPAKWKEEYDFLKQRNGEKILCFCATPEWIGREWRCLFVGQELVGISDYMYGGNILDNPQEYICDDKFMSLINEIRGNGLFSPEDNLTIDIGEREDGSYGLVEINCLETSGWYSANAELVYEELAKQLNYE